MWMEHLTLLLLWLGYYGMHSALASKRVKQLTKLGNRTYRLLYTFISTVLFIILLFISVMIYTMLMFAPGAVSNYLGLMLAATGLFIIKRAFRAYSFREFIGLKKSEYSQLVTTGIQSKVRHPLYLGSLLIAIGYVLFNPLFSSLVVLVALIIYLPFGIRWEEKKLTEAYGHQYEQYKEKVPALFPRIINPF